MKKHTIRNIVLVASAIFTFFYIYPTLGWMWLSSSNPEVAKARQAQWTEEDKHKTEPNFFTDSYKSLKRWAQFDEAKQLKLGLDLQGGIDMVLEMDIDSLPAERKKELEDQNLDIPALRDAALHRIWVRARDKDFEAKEPTITPVGSNQIRVQLPGERDVNRAKRLIMQAAYLTFNLAAGPDQLKDAILSVDKFSKGEFMKRVLMPDPTSKSGRMFRVKVEDVEFVREQIDAAKKVGNVLPEGKIIALSQPPKDWAEQTYDLYLIDEKPLMEGQGLTGAMPSMDAGKNMILFRFDPTGADKFAEITRNNIGQSMAIVLDGAVVSAPTIQSEIHGSGQITGDFTLAEAKDFAIALNSGALPVPLKEAYTGIVGPSLGKDSIRNGTIASLASLVLIVIFMLFYYRSAGAVANVALVANAFMILALMAYFRVTLTMPGIAGLVLTMGMAVDGNILIYERIREEIRNGKSLLAAIGSGFERAQVTVLDTNITTLIAGVVMYQFGTGPIQGFALALSIGIASTMFSNLVVARAMFDFLTLRKWLGEKIHMMAIFPVEPKWGFMKIRIPNMIGSAIVILIGVVWAFARGGDMMGVDFRNGTSMVVGINASATVPVDSVRQQLASIGFAQAQVQMYTEASTDAASAAEQKFLINITESEQKAVTESVPAPPAGTDTAMTAAAPAAASPAGDTATQSVSSRIQDSLKALAADPNADNAVELIRVETIGASVGKELRKDAILAVLWSTFFILLYLWFRYELKFAVGALVALIHDVLITVGAFALTGREITLPVIAAILTIIGYSLNDTIVVFDRVREDLKLYRGRGYTLEAIMERSVNQTLSRTILTAFTVLITVVILYFFGGGVLEDFAFAMIIGTIIGTYSSIYIACPFAYYWDKYFGTPAPTGSATQGEAAGSRRRPQRRQENGSTGVSEV